MNVHCPKVSPVQMLYCHLMARACIKATRHFKKYPEQFSEDNRFQAILMNSSLARMMSIGDANTAALILSKLHHLIIPNGYDNDEFVDKVFYQIRRYDEIMLRFYYNEAELPDEDLRTLYMMIYHGQSSLLGPPVYPKDMEAFREVLHRDIEAATTTFANLSKILSIAMANIKLLVALIGYWIVSISFYFIY